MPDEPVIKPPIMTRPVIRQPVVVRPVIEPPGVPLRPIDEVSLRPVTGGPDVPGVPIVPVVPVIPIPVVPKGTTLTAGKPVTTTVPTLQVAGPTVPGTYTYSLVVVDDLGMSSNAATIQVVFTALVIG